MIIRELKYFTFLQYNTAFQDSHLMVKNNRESEIILFDLGELNNIPLKDILRIRHIFITHFHMDHFIGLAQLIRSFLTCPSSVHITLYGPAGLIYKVSHLIDSFTWNLLDENSFKLSLVEIHPTEIRQLKNIVFHQLIHHLDDVVITNKSQNIYQNDYISVECISLNHKITSLGYKMTSRQEILFNKEKECPYPPNIWIKEAKTAIVNQELDKILSIDNHRVSMESLMPYFQIIPEESFVYLTDFSYKETTADIIGFTKNVKILFIENHFLEKDDHLAKQTHHLSSIDVKEIIQKSQVQDFVLQHFSRRYIGQYSYQDFINQVK